MVYWSCCNSERQAQTSLRPISNNSFNAVLRYPGFDRDTVTGNGFRATARTILDEVLGFRVDLIEHQLAHAVRDPNGRPYNRTSFIDDRHQMMQGWADYLGKVTPHWSRGKVDNGNNNCLKSGAGITWLFCEEELSSMQERFVGTLISR